MTEEFPRTLTYASKLVDIDPNAFVQYTVCSKCDAVFTYEHGFTLQGNHWQAVTQMGNMTFHFHYQILTLNCCHQNVKESLPPLKKKSSKMFADFCIPMSIFYTFLPFMNTPDVA